MVLALTSRIEPCRIALWCQQTVVVLAAQAVVSVLGFWSMNLSNMQHNMIVGNQNAKYVEPTVSVLSGIAYCGALPAKVIY